MAGIPRAVTRYATAGPVTPAQEKAALNAALYGPNAPYSQAQVMSGMPGQTIGSMTQADLAALTPDQQTWYNQQLAAMNSYTNAGLAGSLSYGPPPGGFGGQQSTVNQGQLMLAQSQQAIDQSQFNPNMPATPAPAAAASAGTTTAPPPPPAPPNTTTRTNTPNQMPTPQAWLAPNTTVQGNTFTGNPNSSMTPNTSTGTGGTNYFGPDYNAASFNQNMAGAEGFKATPSTSLLRRGGQVTRFAAGGMANPNPALDAPISGGPAFTQAPGWDSTLSTYQVPGYAPLTNQEVYNLQQTIQANPSQPFLSPLSPSGNKDLSSFYGIPPAAAAPTPAAAAPFNPPPNTTTRTNTPNQMPTAKDWQAPNTTLQGNTFTGNPISSMTPNGANNGTNYFGPDYNAGSFNQSMSGAEGFKATPTTNMLAEGGTVNPSEQGNPLGAGDIQNWQQAAQQWWGNFQNESAMAGNWTPPAGWTPPANLANWKTNIQNWLSQWKNQTPTTPTTPTTPGQGQWGRDQGRMDHHGWRGEGDRDWDRGDWGQRDWNQGQGQQGMGQGWQQGQQGQDGHGWSTQPATPPATPPTNTPESNQWPNQWHQGQQGQTGQPGQMPASAWLSKFAPQITNLPGGWGGGQQAGGMGWGNNPARALRRGGIVARYDDGGGVGDGSPGSPAGGGGGPAGTSTSVGTTGAPGGEGAPGGVGAVGGLGPGGSANATSGGDVGGSSGNSVGFGAPGGAPAGPGGPSAGGGGGSGGSGGGGGGGGGGGASPSGGPGAGTSGTGGGASTGSVGGGGHGGSSGGTSSAQAVLDQQALAQAAAVKAAQAQAMHNQGISPGVANALAGSLGLGQNNALSQLVNANPTPHVTTSPLGPPQRGMTTPAALGQKSIGQLGPAQVALMANQQNNNLANMLGAGVARGGPSGQAGVQGPGQTMGFPSLSGVSPGLGTPPSPGPSQNRGVATAPAAPPSTTFGTPSPAQQALDAQAQAQVANMPSPQAQPVAMLAPALSKPAAPPSMAVTGGANNTGGFGAGISGGGIPAPNPAAGAVGPQTGGSGRGFWRGGPITRYDDGGGVSASPVGMPPGLQSQGQTIPPIYYNPQVYAGAGAPINKGVSQSTIPSFAAMAVPTYQRGGIVGRYSPQRFAAGGGVGLSLDDPEGESMTGEMMMQERMAGDGGGSEAPPTTEAPLPIRDERVWTPDTPTGGGAPAPGTEPNAADLPAPDAQDVSSMHGYPRFTIPGGSGGMNPRMSVGGVGSMGAGAAPRAPSAASQRDSTAPVSAAFPDYAPSQNAPKEEADVAGPPINQQGDLSGSFLGVLAGAIQHIMGVTQPGAQVPPNSDVAQARADFVSKPTDEDHQAHADLHSHLGQHLDQAATMDNAERNINGMYRASLYYYANGDNARGNATAAGMLNYTLNMAALYGEEAVKRFHGGDIQGTIDLLAKGHQFVPDGTQISGTYNAQTGMSDMELRNMRGVLKWQGEVAPQEILAAATGAGDKSMLWKIVQSEAANAGDVMAKESLTKQQQEQTEADASEAGKSIGGGWQAIPARAGGGHTPESTAPVTTVSAAQPQVLPDQTPQGGVQNASLRARGAEAGAAAAQAQFSPAAIEQANVVAKQKIDAQYIDPDTGNFKRSDGQELVPPTKPDNYGGRDPVAREVTAKYNDALKEYNSEYTRVWNQYKSDLAASKADVGANARVAAQTALGDRQRRSQLAGQKFTAFKTQETQEHADAAKAAAVADERNYKQNDLMDPEKLRNVFNSKYTDPESNMTGTEPIKWYAQSPFYSRDATGNPIKEADAITNLGKEYDDPSAPGGGGGAARVDTLSNALQDAQSTNPHVPTNELAQILSGAARNSYVYQNTPNTKPIDDGRGMRHAVTFYRKDGSPIRTLVLREETAQELQGLSKFTSDKQAYIKAHGPPPPTQSGESASIPAAVGAATPELFPSFAPGKSPADFWRNPTGANPATAPTESASPWDALGSWYNRNVPGASAPPLKSLRPEPPPIRGIPPQ